MSSQSRIPGGSTLLIVFLKISFDTVPTSLPQTSAEAPTTPTRLKSYREHGLIAENPVKLEAEVPIIWKNAAPSVESAFLNTSPRCSPFFWYSAYLSGL